MFVRTVVDPIHLGGLASFAISFAMEVGMMTWDDDSDRTDENMDPICKARVKVSISDIQAAL